MPQAIFAYHLGMDAEQYAFFRIPKLLITEPYFRWLSTDAKLLYGLMLDRMSLSMKNGWMDDDGHVYIYFTLEEACEQLCCKTDKAVKLFAELDSAKGVGLIRRVKQGLGRPAKIYVLRFMGMEDEPGEDTPEPELPSCRNPDFGKTEVKSSEKPKSGPRKIRSQDLGKTECNKTDKNNTELSNTDSSIHPGAQPEEVIEEYRKEIRENIEYDHLRRQHPYDDIDEIADLMLEVLCTQDSFMRIGGKQLYTALMPSNFSMLSIISTSLLLVAASVSGASGNSTVGISRTSPFGRVMVSGWSVSAANAAGIIVAIKHRAINMDNNLFFMFFSSLTNRFIFPASAGRGTNLDRSSLI